MARPRAAKVKKVVILSVRCTKEESDQIREEAQQSHRSISALMLHATLDRIKRSHPGRFDPAPAFGLRNAGD